MTVVPQAPDILSAEFAADPYPAYRVLREHYPLLHHAGTDSWLLSRYDDVERAFRDPVFTTDNYDWQLEPVHGGRTIVQMSGHEHAVRRALVAPAFRGRELRERFLPVIERNAAELIDAFRDAPEVDLVDRFATRFPVNVIVDMLGLDRADHDRFHQWYAAVVGFFANLGQDPEVAEAGLRASRELAAYLLPVIRERRTAPGADLLSSLCTAEVDGTTMTDQDITSFVSLLLSAGGETTDKAIAGMFRNLLAHPEQFAAVLADRELVPAAFAESLRYTPPLQMIMREAAEDVVVERRRDHTGGGDGHLPDRLGEPRRDALRPSRHVQPVPDRPDGRQRVQRRGRPPVLRARPALLRRGAAGQDRDRVRRQPIPRRLPAHGLRRRRPAADSGVFVRGPRRLTLALAPDAPGD